MHDYLKKALDGEESLDHSFFRGHEKCQGCGTRGSLFMEIAYTQKDGETLLVKLCLNCVGEVSKELHKEFFKYCSGESTKKNRDDISKKLKLSEFETPTTEQEWVRFLEELDMRYPEFYRYFIQFSDGKFTLHDGSQDEVLTSISNFVQQQGRFPSKKQVDYFISRCGDLMKRKDEGLPLKSKEQLRVDIKIAQRLFKKLDGKKSTLSLKQREVLKDIKQYAEKRGYVSTKQFRYLESFLSG